MITKSGEAIRVFLVMLLGLCGACDDAPLAPTRHGVQFPEGETFHKLSDYNLFEEPLAVLIPKEGVLPYDLNAPLFSDYAFKQRFVYVPEGKTIAYDTTDALSFPVGSILVKHFYYTLATGDSKIIETRLLLNQSSGWNAEVYEWNDEQTEATRIIAGKEETISFLKNGSIQTSSYQVPNKNQCKTCHSFGNKIIPIGPKVGNLNRTYGYKSGPQNQIDKWVEEKILMAPSGHVPKWPDYTSAGESLVLRARAYLEVNCAHCHRREGAASNSGLYLGYHNYDSLSYGFYKKPVAAGAGSGELRYDIVPGNAAESILYYRMNSTNTKVRMPEFGRNLIDEQGIALIKEWIDAMD
jgi:uncharacterized repeat protein (TIGR03806 family)